MANEKNFIATDLNTGAIVADRVTVASRRLERAVGLLRRDHLDPGEALWITPCNGVHTWFMRFPIDVLALDANGVVVDVVSDMGPWRMRLPRPGSVSVIEFRAGTLANAGMKVGHRIKIEGSEPA
jgi:uncharacterized membrane protein (UPF0127 family)